MPSKLRDSSPERRRDRDRDRDREKKDSTRDKADRDKDRDREKDRKERHHRSSTHRKLSTREQTASPSSPPPFDEKRRSSMPHRVEDEPVGPPKSESKTSLPYPTFSKEHSREAVGGGNRPVLKVDVFTPPATDVNASKDKLSTPSKSASTPHAPPSPPLTDQNAGKWKSSGVKTVTVETIQEEGRPVDKDARIKARLKPHASRSNGHMRSSSELGTEGSIKPVKSRDQAGTPLKREAGNQKSPQRSVSQPIRSASPTTANSTTEDENPGSGSSEATSIAPEQPTIQRPGSKVPPSPAVYDLQNQGGPTVVQPQSRGVTPMDVFIEEDVMDFGSSRPTSTTGMTATPGPPPPPPPPMPIAVPRVDYLLKNGGLNQVVPKNLLLAGKPMAIQQAMSPGGPTIVVANLFEPYHHLLNDFEHVIAKNGSVAVATGYRSVARRLLDRLEAVFARDISSENCQCPLCTREAEQHQDQRGVSWGEVLELVSGRKDLPPWPPFSFTNSPVGLGIALELHLPMQKLDIDVPEEYREHYIRQSKKTKQSVDRWLNRNSENPENVPEEVDDETLTFAILTHLSAEQRPAFKDLLGIVDRPIEPPRRIPTPELGSAPRPAPTPAPRPRIRLPHILTASAAIQRLYRLAYPPRDPEAAIYLVNNPTLHNALATLAAISNDEWDILISGRFDGFLRSGADDLPPDQIPPACTPSTSRPPTRGLTPQQVNGRSRQGSYSNPAGASAQYGAPIAFDEETELATLAEIERDIYAGMEALEDAFEALHQKAETIRLALRERSAGLAAARSRRSAQKVEVRMDTPASCADGSGVGMNGTDGRWEAETDDGMGDWDGGSEIAPDDSASNISSARKRRPKRRNERRTPRIEEEDEEESEGTVSPVKGRR